jgi:N-acetylglutamate synthase-like GNAT family acetyltransferase
MSNEPPHHTFTLESGETVVVRPATTDDYPGISRLIQDNFAHDESYSGLSDEARAAYIEANSLEGIREVCSHPQTLLRLVATVAATREIIGFALYRRSAHLITGEEVAEGKRLQIARHMRSRGLGERLLKIARQQLREMGIKKTVGYTSGKSLPYCENQGLRRLATLDNPALAKRGLKAEASYVEYLL